LSNTLINHNQRLHEKALITTNEAGEKIILYHGVNEAKFIAKKIKELVASGEFKYEDIAILYRNNTLSRSIENELANARIPYYIYGGLRFYQRREIKDLLAYLRLMVNFNDELSLKRVINVPKRGIGLARIAVLTNYALQNHCTFADAMRASHDDDIVQFLNLIDGFRFQTKDLTVSETLIYIMEKIKYQDFLKDQDDDFDARSENIDELISSIQIYEQNAADPHDINAYLQEIALYTDVSKKKERNLDTVSLMTIHIAKGSEYPVVFIAGINDGILPSGKAENISEERRLFYVAITRAKKLLFLSYSTSYNPRTKADDTKSRFINEIDQNVIEEITDHYQPISDQDTP
jgi:DNA helicase-2/ATP-dependent DNA helicase PcrA